MESDRPARRRGCARSPGAARSSRSPRSPRSPRSTGCSGNVGLRFERRLLHDRTECWTSNPPSGCRHLERTRWPILDHVHLHPHKHDVRYLEPTDTIGCAIAGVGSPNSVRLGPDANQAVMALQGVANFTAPTTITVGCSGFTLRFSGQSDNNVLTALKVDAIR
jgi:hypothetical protein